MTGAGGRAGQACTARTGALDIIRAQYPDWQPFTSDAGRWWASRPARTRGGTARTVDGDTPDQLLAAIRAQDARDARDAPG